MAQHRSYARGGGEDRSGGDRNAGANTAIPPPTTPQLHTVPSVDAAELTAGCALNEGFRLLQYQLAGVPPTLRALLGWVERGKMATILARSAMALGATLTRKLALVPSLLVEWQGSPSLLRACILSAQARRLLADVPFTRPFLRTQSRAFHEAVAAGTSELPTALCQVTQQAIGAAEEQIRTSCHRLVETHLYMVHFIAQEYRAVGIPEEDVHDLIQEGSLGLLAAAERFDVRAGARFRTYAPYSLRQAVTRALRTRRIVLPPRAQQRIARQLTRKAAQLEQLFTHAISPDELATATGMSPRDIAAAFATQRREISLDTPLGDGRSWADVLAPHLTNRPTTTNGPARKRRRTWRGYGRDACDKWLHLPPLPIRDVAWRSSACVRTDHRVTVSY